MAKGKCQRYAMWCCCKTCRWGFVAFRFRKSDLGEVLEYLIVVTLECQRFFFSGITGCSCTKKVEFYHDIVGWLFFWSWCQSSMDSVHFQPLGIKGVSSWKRVVMVDWRSMTDSGIPRMQRFECLVLFSKSSRCVWRVKGVEKVCRLFLFF